MRDFESEKITVCLKRDGKGKGILMSGVRLLYLSQSNGWQQESKQVRGFDFGKILAS